MINEVSKVWVRALIFALAVDVLFALLIRVDDLVELVHGDGDRGTVVAVMGLGWQFFVLLCAAVVASSLLKARRELHSRQQALAAVAATSTDWLWESDTQWRLTYSSAGVKELLGYEATELLGQSALRLMPKAHQQVAEALMRKSVAEAQGWDGVEMTFLTRDGTEVLVKGKAGAVSDPQSRVVGFRGVWRAISPAEMADRLLAGARHRVAAVLETEGLQVAMQPIVDLTSGRLVGVEALARFPDGRAPDLWFREAADVGCGLELDRLAFRRALAALHLLPDRCYLSVNATPEYALSGLLTTDLLATDLPLERIVIEVTEHARVANYRDLRAVLDPLRERGVRLAVDDTGAGYASLTHVLQLHPSIIKIDRSLITDIADDAARRSLVTALVILALELDASVTGEGIETASEIDTLATLGVDSGQGYFFAKPVTDTSRWQQWGDRAWLPSARSTTPPTTAADPTPEPTSASSSTTTAGARSTSQPPN